MQQSADLWVSLPQDAVGAKRLLGSLDKHLNEKIH